MKTPWDGLVWWYVCSVLPGAFTYLLLVPDSTPLGAVIFNATLPRLGRTRQYSLHVHKNAEFVRRLLNVDANNGQVSVAQHLDCRGIWYPNLFTLHVESVQVLEEWKTKRRRERAVALSNVPGVQYYAMTLRVIITGPECDQELQFEDSRFAFQLTDAKKWVSESYASFAMPSESDFTKICLRQSQFINSISAFLPSTLLSDNCAVRYISVDDHRFEVETSVGDLVSAYDQCITEPLWKIVIQLEITCFSDIRASTTMDHHLVVVYYHEHLNDTDIARRVRRELKNQSPFFDQVLYQANVLEEKPSGVVVATLRARDPENSPITYSMTSLLDSRSQGMFGIDESTGVVTTQTRLDRELVDVHYFRVLAIDDSFPPRSGSTTLQVNVLDANDHAPVFEKDAYETSLREGVAPGTVVITVRATDKDVNRNAEIEYSFEEAIEEFHVDGKSGVISTRKTLDREVRPNYVLTVLARDNSVVSERKSASTLVNIRLIDDNDNYPQFTEKSYSVTIAEDVDVSDNPVVASIRATDADEGQNAALRYAIIGGNMQAQFSIDSVTGDVSLAKPLDYEQVRSYRVVVRAQDGGSPSRSNTTSLLVSVKDVNDNAPRFYSTLFQESVLESVPINSTIIRVQAYDADEGSNSALRYSMSIRDEAGAPTADMPLRVDPLTGWIHTTRPLDREHQSKYQFQVIAEDGGTPARSASASVAITVQDVNDNDPQFQPKLYEVVVSEQDPPGTLVTTITATDPDESPRLHYEITNGNVRGRFSITSQNNLGLVTIAYPLDYRQEKRYVLTVTATDAGGRSDIATIYVNVSDANNYAPMFENAPYSAQVFEDAPVGTTVLVVQAADADVGQNAQITYSLSSTDQSQDSFSINQQTGALITTKLLDREVTSSYLLTLTARDGGIPSLSDTTDVEISVQDVNDNPPVFSTLSYQASVVEDAVVGTSVVQVQASDVDIGLNGRIRYSLSAPGTDLIDNSFAVDPSSGVIRTAKALDRESVPQYQLTVYAVDRGTPALSATATVYVRIEDVNDSPPAFESEKLVMYIPENSPVGSTVGELRARDPDEGMNADVHYSIIGGEDAASFSLFTRPGWDKAELITMVELDYESSRKKFELLVRAASPPLRSDVRVEILVTDVNDNAPVLKDFQVVFNNYRDCFPPGPIGVVPAFDADVADQLHFRILSGNNANLVTINETSGEINLSSQLNTNVPKLASMDISVTDGVNEVKATMTLSVRLISETLLLNSVTVRLEDMTVDAFLSPLLGFFVDALAAIIPCPRDLIYLFDVQEDTDVSARILNVSFSARRPDLPGEVFFSPQYLQERVYLNRPILARLSTVRVLPFDDNLCLREPCLNFETCLTVLKFGNASDFIASDSVLFRPIHPVSTFSCVCPSGFSGSREHYLCDTEVDLCYSSPCHNGGTCRRKEGGYTCSCKSGFVGENCEIDANLDTCQPGVCNTGLCAPLLKGGGFECHCHGSEVYSPKSPLGVSQLLPKRGGVRAPLSDHDHNEYCQLRARAFSKTAFLTFPALRQRHRLHIQFKFATQSENGLLLYNGRYNEEHDFIALELINSTVQVSFSLGSGVSRAVAAVPGGLSDGQWHTVTLLFLNKTATVSLDDCDVSLALKRGPELGPRWSCANRTQAVLEPRCSIFTEPCHRHLDLTGPLQLGGLPSLPTEFQVTHKDFEGCISDLYIDYKFIDMNSYVVDNGTHPGCHHKRNFCSSNPCKQGGKCKEGWGTYICECRDGNGGKDCSQGIKTSWRFRGDGVLSFNPLLRPIQLPWINSLSVRTLQKEAFLMSIQIGQNSSAIMTLKEGFLRYSYNGESVQLRQGLVSDGVWHHVEAKWMSNDVWLSLDHGQREVTQAFNAKVQGLYVGKILIGGADASYASLASDFGYFEGCIQDVKVGNSQSSLQRPTVEENVSEGCGSPSACGDANCPAHSDCVDQWERAVCDCHRGFVTNRCTDVCQYDPCDHGGRCEKSQSDWRGYSCTCQSDEYSGEYCERRVEQPCPSAWWGYPVCGPCQCNVELGYDSVCNKTTGECRCKDHHYQLPGSERCLPCDCYSVGSYHARCDSTTGQCPCRPGVIGRRCDSCTNKYAEVTLEGCEVVYDGCPRDFESGIWWDRTKFGETTLATCPSGSVGKGSRLCNSEVAEWDPPDLFNCTSNRFIDLRKLLSQIEADDLEINTYVAVKAAADLQKATNMTTKMYGADILIAQQLVTRMLLHELKMSGLNLSHSQDKDYISNLVQSSSAILKLEYSSQWDRVIQLTDAGPTDLVGTIELFLDRLVMSQRDTYTSPFEVVSDNVILGMDVVTPSSLFGYERSKPDILQKGTEKVIVPDTSDFLYPPLQLPLSNRREDNSPAVKFPKYNNYLQDVRLWDHYTKVLIPINLLGIPTVIPGEVRVAGKSSEHSAVLSYALYREAGELYGELFDDTVTKRWGIQLKVGSHVISFQVLVPQIPTDRDEYEDDTDSLITYESLNNLHITSPVRVQMWLDSALHPDRSNPQCVHWVSTPGPGPGLWSRSGCHTDLPEETDSMEPYVVNCTCYHLSTFAVLVDKIDLDFVPEPSFLEEILTYIGFTLSITLLILALFFLSCIRGRATNSNSIHKNIVICVLGGELVYFAALKLRRDLIVLEFACKMIAMFLHYFWLSAFSWNLVDSLHLHRMLSELRDVNHGQMRFYYCLGYGVPAVIVGLSVGVRADQYGNFYFCWLSLYESVVWSLVGPICLAVAVTLLTLMLSVNAAFTIKDHVLGYGNLRTLVWVSVVSLPLLGVVWVLLMLHVSEPHLLIPPALCLAVVLHAAFVLAGYCFLNTRVRRNIYASFLKCLGREVPKDLDLSIDAIGSSSHVVTDRATSATRSALAYRNTGVSVSVRRTLGIAASSTTSRSTTKTSSSPYRSDTQMRHGGNTDTSTSNYTSASELRRYPHHNVKEERSRTHSDSDSENSVDGRSLELASSHSSDDDISSRHQSTLKSSRKAATSFLPNIREANVPAPPTLSVNQPDLFPNLSPLYAPRWSSQIPHAYHTELGDVREEETSPQPLPHPGLSDFPGHTKEDTEYHVNLATVYEHDVSNYNTEAEDDEKPQSDKYLFPYTAEEDHLPAIPTSRLPPLPPLPHRDSPSLRSSRDSPIYGSYGYATKLSQSPRASPAFSHSRESPYGVRSSPLLGHPPPRSSHPSPLHMAASNMEIQASLSESEKDMSETPV